MATDTKATLIKLFDALRECREKEDAVLAEIATLLSGGEGIGDKLKRLKVFWCATWQERHHEPFDFDHAKHTAFLKKKLALHAEEIITAKMYSFLMGHEPAAEKARHPFGWFMAGFNSYKGVVHDLDQPNESAQKAREMRGV